MLARAVGPSRIAAAQTPVSIQDGTSSSNSVINLADNSSAFWSSLNAALANDPLYQSANVQIMSRDPFHREPATETAQAPAVDVPKVAVESDDEPVLPSLELGSIVIGRTRRAAMINGQLYNEGKRFQSEGRNYTLAKVEANRVVLTTGSQSIELKMLRTQLKDVLEQAEP